MPSPIIITPRDRAHWLDLRLDDVTSTESPVLFGMSPYMTVFELWHRKKSRATTEIEQTERMKWGTRLEAAIAAGVCEDMGWGDDGKIEDYYRHGAVLGMGASMDHAIWDKTRPRADMCGLLEIKNVDHFQYTRNEWSDTDAPAHIEIQLQHQLEVADLSWGAIAVLRGGNAPTVLIRERDRETGAAIVRRITEFWATVDANQPPDPDFNDDAETIRDLHRFASVGKSTDMTDNNRLADLCAKYRAAADVKATVEKEREAALAEILTIIGDADRVTAPGFKITAGTVAETEVAYTRKAYRNVRVSPVK